MCHRVACPNDGRPTWWGCGHHVESALAGVPANERCACPHERIPYLPLMQRVKKLADVPGTSDDADLALSVSTAAEPVLSLASNRDETCLLGLEITLPPSVAFGALPPGMTADTEKNVLKLATRMKPHTPLALPLRVVKAGDGALAIFGPDAGTIRRQWNCIGDEAPKTEFEDIHARLDVVPQSGFLFGGGNNPTIAVACLLVLWVLYRMFFVAEKEKRA